MFKHRVVMYALVASTVLNLSACKSKTQSTQTPNPVQSVDSRVPARSDEESCRTFLQKFYDWRTSLMVDMFCSHLLKGTSATQEAINREEEECRVASAYRGAERLSLNQVLSTELQHYIEREEAVKARDNDPGLDFDPYLNTQDPSPRFVVDSVQISGNRCDAIVHGYDEGQQREEVMPELSRTGTGWIIKNFHYRFEYEDGKPAQNDDLIHMIRKYVGEVAE